jgi:hypothetical protein
LDASDRQCREGGLAMSRLIWMLMLTGLFAAPGCEQKPVSRPPEKAAPKDVRRDADPPVKAISAISRQTEEEPQEKLAPRPPARTPTKPAPEEVRRDASPVVKTASVYSEEDREVFQKKLESQIDEMDGKITDLREKGRDLRGTAKTAWDQTMAELDVKRDAARAILSKLVHSSGEVWDNTKREAETAWDDLDNTLRDAWKKL